MRRIPKNYRHLTGLVSSAGGSIAFEGSVERDFYALMAHQPSIRDIAEQSELIHYVSEKGRKSQYHPDCLVTFVDPTVKPMLVEVKTREELARNWAKYRSRFKAASRYAQQKGWIFRIYTEREIRTPYLLNLKMLRLHRDHDFLESEIDHIVRLIDASPGIPLRELAKTHIPNAPHRSSAEILSCIYSALQTRRISANLFEPIAWTTQLFPERTWSEYPWDRRWLRSSAPAKVLPRRAW